MTTQSHANAIHKLSKLSDEISIIADVAREYGNERLATMLNRIAWDLSAATEEADNAHGDMLTQRLKESQQMTSAILNATLAGCIIQKEAEKA